MKTFTTIVLASAVALLPLSAVAQDAAPMKSERAMPEKNAMTGKPKPKKSERAMMSSSKTDKAKQKGSERAMDNGAK